MKTKLLSIVTAFTLFTLPQTTYAQAPTLGTTADFVLFSTNGALTNTGLSHLTGNVGSNNGSSTAFGNVNGVMHNNNGASATAAADLLIAYNQLNSAIATFFPAPLLGNGQSLNAGIYAITGNATLSNTLTLNGQGNANSVFIIKIAGAFSAASGAQVVLTNNAKACNVFWKVEGAVSLASGSTLRGTIIANNAAINMNSGVTLEGRALTTAGAITINQILAYTPIGCNSPNLMGPASPTLASAACYAIFSSNGPVSNAGVSSATGDIGTNVGLTTGYNALNVVGNIHPIPDGNTAACASDLLLAYTYLNTLPYDIELLYPAQFGYNLVLTPHVYRMNGATAFTDTLFLDGGGNANAVFVLQLNGALSTSTYAKVSLMNGTQAKNVFWKVEGSVNINNYTEFVGTIIANNGAISLNNGVYVNGRALTTNGALSTSAVTVTIPSACGNVAAPSINTQPADQTVCIGSSVSFSVAASGTALTYQWRVGTANLVNGGPISGATSSVLTINPAAAIDAAANYNVVVSGSATPNVTSANASLTVNKAPIINLEALNQVSCNGSGVSFSVNATGSALVYQWRKGLVSLINAGNISGATTADLVINPVTALDTASNYNVLISGVCAPAVASKYVSLSECSFVGIDAYSLNKAGLLSFYPNPFNTSLNIQLNDNSILNNNNLKVYNLLGAEVISINLIKTITTVETSDLPSGIYFYKLTSNNKTIQSGKLIAQ